MASSGLQVGVAGAVGLGRRVGPGHRIARRLIDGRRDQVAAAAARGSCASGSCAPGRGSSGRASTPRAAAASRRCCGCALGLPSSARCRAVVMPSQRRPACGRPVAASGSTRPAHTARGARSRPRGCRRMSVSSGTPFCSRGARLGAAVAPRPRRRRPGCARRRRAAISLPPQVDAMRSRDVGSLSSSVREQRVAVASNSVRSAVGWRVRLAEAGAHIRAAPPSAEALVPLAVQAQQREAVSPSVSAACRRAAACDADALRQRAAARVAALAAARRTASASATSRRPSPRHCRRALQVQPRCRARARDALVLRQASYVAVGEVVVDGRGRCCCRRRSTQDAARASSCSPARRRCRCASTRPPAQSWPFSSARRGAGR